MSEPPTRPLKPRQPGWDDGVTDIRERWPPIPVVVSQEQPGSGWKHFPSLLTAWARRDGKWVGWADEDESPLAGWVPAAWIRRVED